MERTAGWELRRVFDGIYQLVEIDGDSVKEPLFQFKKKLKKGDPAAQRLTGVLEMVSRSGLEWAFQSEKVKTLDGQIVEIREMSCSVRAFSYLHRDKSVLVIYEVSKTHSGKHKDNYRKAIEEGHRKEGLIKGLIEQGVEDDNER